jgi:hypothetical protein
MVNISHFDCDVLSSTLSPVTNKMLALAYLVKHSVVSGKNWVRVPQSTENWFIVQWIRILCYEHRDRSSTLLKPAK